MVSFQAQLRTLNCSPFEPPLPMMCRWYFWSTVISTNAMVAI